MTTAHPLLNNRNVCRVAYTSVGNSSSIFPRSLSRSGVDIDKHDIGKDSICCLVVYLSVFHDILQLIVCETAGTEIPITSCNKYNSSQIFCCTLVTYSFINATHEATQDRSGTNVVKPAGIRAFAHLQSRIRHWHVHSRAAANSARVLRLTSGLHKWDGSVLNFCVPSALGHLLALAIAIGVYSRDTILHAKGVDGCVAASLEAKLHAFDNDTLQHTHFIPLRTIDAKSNACCFWAECVHRM